MNRRTWGSIALLVLVGFLCLAPAADAREWVEKDGERYHAEYVTVEDSGDGRVVTLEKFNGTRIVKPLSMFSPADQRYVRDVDSGRLSPEPFGRKWTSQSGKKIRAEFKELDGDKVVLETEGGKRISIPLGSLTEADQARVSGGGPGRGSQTVGTEDEFSEFDADLFSDADSTMAPPKTDAEIDMTFETGTPPEDFEKSVWGERLEAKQDFVAFVQKYKLLMLVAFCLGGVTMGVGAFAFLITAFKEGGITWGLGVLLSFMFAIGSVVFFLFISRVDNMSAVLKLLILLGGLFCGCLFPATFLLKFWRYSKGAFFVWLIGFLISSVTIAIPIFRLARLLTGSA